MTTCDLVKFREQLFSQDEGDGVTMELLKQVYGRAIENVINKYYVEFGTEDGSECNTRILREYLGWTGLLMDGNYENEKINLKKEFITKENILELFKKYNVPQHIDLLSVDIDYNDFYCLKEILSVHTCDIIIAEYNASHPPSEDKVVIYNYYGMSLRALNTLAKTYNYSIIYCTLNGVNCFLVHNDIIKSKNLKFKNFGDLESIYKIHRHGYKIYNGGHEPDPLNREYITAEEAMKI